MAELDEDVQGNNHEGAAPASGRQACVRCSGPDVKAVSMSSIAVYLRCDSCGEVWSIPQRRKQPRADDPRKF